MTKNEKELYLRLLQTEFQLLEEKKMNEERLMKLEKEYEHLLKPTLGIKKLHEDAIIPNYQSKKASGFDLHAYLGENTVILAPHSSVLIKTGLSFEIPKGYEVQIRSRSGLAAKYGIQSHFGTIDEDYKGEIGIILFNHSEEPFEINHNDRIAQAVIVPVIQANIVEVDELSVSERGSNGFGSTGLTSNKPI